MDEHTVKLMLQIDEARRQAIARMAKDRREMYAWFAAIVVCLVLGIVWEVIR